MKHLLAVAWGKWVRNQADIYNQAYIFECHLFCGEGLVKPWHMNLENQIAQTKPVDRELIL